MKKWMLAAAVCAAVFTACDKNDDNNDINDTDRDFVTKASLSNNAEVMAGQLAATKGESSMVRDFGQMMVTDHTQAQQDLKNSASALGVPAPDSVDAEHQMLMARLDTLNGYTFDTAYINSQLNDHTQAINLFSTETNSGQNQALRSYASQYLPKLQMHYNKADSIQTEL